MTMFRSLALAGLCAIGSSAFASNSASVIVDDKTFQRSKDGSEVSSVNLCYCTVFTTSPFFISVVRKFKKSEDSYYDLTYQNSMEECEEARLIDTRCFIEE